MEQKGDKAGKKKEKNRLKVLVSEFSEGSILDSFDPRW
jgi:hypothetical protein